MVSSNLYGEAPLSELDYLDPIPSAVSATRQRLPLSQSPSSVTIISREMIEALPSPNLVDALKLVPGFQVFFANGSMQSVTANGQSDRFPVAWKYGSMVEQSIRRSTRPCPGNHWHWA